MPGTLKTAEELLPEGVACAGMRGIRPDAEFRKEMDILDVWFESGASWHAVLEQEPELQLSGGPVYGGRRPASGVVSFVAADGGGACGARLRTGWWRPRDGRWMSRGGRFRKSLGNGVDPVDVAKRMGAEIIRLWVASVDFREDVAASENLMQRVSDNYSKLRNTLRFLLGNLHDFVPASDAVAFAKMEPLDQYILARTAELDAKIRAAYDRF